MAFTSYSFFLCGGVVAKTNFILLMASSNPQRLVRTTMPTPETKDKKQQIIRGAVVG